MRNMRHSGTESCPFSLVERLRNFPFWSNVSERGLKLLTSV